MEKIQKLKLNKEFRRAYGRGRSFVHPGAVIYVTGNGLGCTRFGITAGKKIGNAVLRNRAKRVITAAYRECAPHLRGGHDIVIVARVRTPKLSSMYVKQGMEQNFRKAGIWVDENEMAVD